MEDLEAMIEKYCTCCGSQSCIPWREEDRMECPHFNPEVKQQQEEFEKWLDENHEFLKSIAEEVGIGRKSVKEGSTWFTDDLKPEEIAVNRFAAKVEIALYEKLSSMMYEDEIDEIIAVVDSLADEELDRNSGLWINHRNDDGNHIADCGICKSDIQWHDPDPMPKYCCICGARMKGIKYND